MMSATFILMCHCEIIHRNRTHFDRGQDETTTRVDLTINPEGTQLTVVAPGQKLNQTPIIVTTSYGKVNAGVFTYIQSAVRPFMHLLGLSPISGPETGGTIVKLNFIGNYNYSPVGQTYFLVPDVYFGAIKSTNVYIDSADKLNAVSPPGAGFVDVTLRCPLIICYAIGTTEAVPFRYTP